MTAVAHDLKHRGRMTIPRMRPQCFSTSGTPQEPVFGPGQPRLRP
jgi:hypothetical protein